MYNAPCTLLFIPAHRICLHVCHVNSVIDWPWSWNIVDKLTWGQGYPASQWRTPTGDWTTYRASMLTCRSLRSGSSSSIVTGLKTRLWEVVIWKLSAIYLGCANNWLNFKWSREMWSGANLSYAKNSDFSFMPQAKPPMYTLCKYNSVLHLWPKVCNLVRS